jgi:hypothetical protein
VLARRTGKLLPASKRQCTKWRSEFNSGGATPFILSRSGEGFAIMGECYVHGRMQGEGVKLGEEKDIMIFQEL